jgi:hypothetical protein
MCKFKPEDIAALQRKVLLEMRKPHLILTGRNREDVRLFGVVFVLRDVIVDVGRLVF